MLQGFFNWLTAKSKAAVLRGVQEAADEIERAEVTVEAVRLTLGEQTPQLPAKKGKT